jgi:hypothetical protein
MNRCFPPGSSRRVELLTSRWRHGLRRWPALGFRLVPAVSCHPPRQIPMIYRVRWDCRREIVSRMKGANGFHNGLTNVGERKQVTHPDNSCLNMWAGGARTHDRRIMSRSLGVQQDLPRPQKPVFTGFFVRRVWPVRVVFGSSWDKPWDTTKCTYGIWIFFGFSFETPVDPKKM